MIKCIRCGRKPRKLKESPFSETFYGTFVRKEPDIIGCDKLVSMCPECMEKWGELRKEKKNKFKREMDRIKYYFVARRSVPERALLKKKAKA